MSNEQHKHAPERASPNEARLASEPDDRQREHNQPPAASRDDERRVRSGADSRRRGWYWHWNQIITEYAPLIGLKGVGLLNSYTVWTDRREHSPHRGYAFPSQQTEAAFYGEDRAEIITINKILVALDLVEIRKEMVTRPDAQGRRWKVPHNFYRVKDRPDGVTLTAADVLRVVELAGRDRSVYRYIRKIFSQRFAPIDRDNVWHTILSEVQGDATWQRLTARTQKQEARASARSKAGHRARKSNEEEQDNPKTAGQDRDDQSPADVLLTSGQYSEEMSSTNEHSRPTEPEAQPSVAANNSGPAVDVAKSNRGPSANDDVANNGSSRKESSDDEPTNNGPASSVAASNTMYYQEKPTTTTTTTSATEQKKDRPTRRQSGNDHPNDSGKEAGHKTSSIQESEAARAPNSTAEANSAGDESAERGAPDKGGFGPLGDPSTLVVSLFEAANDRPASPLERVLLSELERDADVAAQAAGSDGPAWVAAAVREAVSSGSSFVAPKRIREILGRWAAEQAGPERPRSRATAGSGAVAAKSSKLTRELHEMIKHALGDNDYARWFRSARVDALDQHQVRLTVPNAAVAEQLANTYRPTLEQALASLVGRGLTITFVVDETIGGAERAVAQPDADDLVTIGEADLPQARQLWQLVLDDLRAVAGSAELDRIRAVTPLGVDADGRLLLGAAGRLSEQMLQRFEDDIARALERVFGRHCSLAIVPRAGWRTATADEQ